MTSYLYEIRRSGVTLATGRFPSERFYRIGDSIEADGYWGEIVDLVPLRPEAKLIVEIEEVRWPGPARPSRPEPDPASS